MSLVGSVSLTNKTGLFLGSVNVDNFNLQANQIAYSDNGTDLEGLNIGVGLQKLNDNLKTIGNPDIQLTVNSIYVNDNIKSIQTAIDESTQAHVIYVSAGSYGGLVSIVDKVNIAIQCPDVGNTICEALDGILIGGTSEAIRIANLQIEPGVDSSIISGVGRHVFKNVVFQGFQDKNHIIEIGKNSTKFMTFVDCEFDEFCAITISPSLGNTLYFINCNFNGCSINYNNSSPLLVIMSNCANLLSFPTTSQATLIATNILSSGISTNHTTLLNSTNIANITSASDISYDGQKLKVGPIRLDPTTTTSKTINLTNIVTPSAADQALIMGHDVYGKGASVMLGSQISRPQALGTYNVCLGSFNSQSLTTGNGNVILGSNAGRSITSGTGNSILGVGSGDTFNFNSSNIVGSGSQLASGRSNCSILGNNVSADVVSGNNQIQLGDSNTSVYVYGSIQDRSDIRDKNHIRDSTLGLDFVNKLRPIEFKWDYREDYIETIYNDKYESTIIHHPKDGSKTRNRYHCGLIAQEVQTLCNNENIDFGGLQDHKINNGDDRLTIGYTELIAPLIKAIQELTERIKILENK